MTKNVWRLVFTAITLISTLLCLAPPASASWPNDFATTYCSDHSAYGCATGELTEHTIGPYYDPCEFSGNSVQMYDNGGNACANHDIQFINLGTPCSGCQDVRLYFNSYYTGAWACITPGWQWIDGQYAASTNHSAITFSFGSGLKGYGYPIWNQVASEKWAGTCS